MHAREEDPKRLWAAVPARHTPKWRFGKQLDGRIYGPRDQTLGELFSISKWHIVILSTDSVLNDDIAKYIHVDFLDRHEERSPLWRRHDAPKLTDHESRLTNFV